MANRLTLDDAVRALGGKREGSGYRAPCPVHGGDGYNLAIDAAADGGGPVFFCHSHGCDSRSILAAVRERAGAPTATPAPRVAALNRAPLGPAAATYVYRDADNLPVGEVRRYALPGGGKTFRQYGPDGTPKAPLTLKTTPYNLPAVRTAVAAGRVVFVVEGEKDVETLKTLGLVATCNAGGAGKWTAAHAAHLTNAARIVLLPDNDVAGRDHMRDVARTLAALDPAPDVFVVELPGLDAKGDATDWACAGGTRDALEGLVRNAARAPVPARAAVAAIPATLPRGERLTDVGNGERFALQHGACVRFAHDVDRWLVWDGARWRYDERGQVDALAKQVVRQMYAAAATTDDERERKALAAFARQSERAAALKAMLTLARSEPEVQSGTDEFDIEPELLTVANGTLDLRTRTLRPHDPADRITRLAPVAYDPDARCPRFERFLLEVFSGDLALALFVQRAVGYSLTGMGKEHALLVLHGGGENGKTTFLELVADLLGDYARTVDIGTLTDAGAKTGPRPELLVLRGPRFVHTVEPNKQVHLNEGLVKQLTGGDRVTARALHSNQMVEFRPAFTLWLACNPKPVIKGTDRGIWRRVMLVPFRAHFPADRREAGLDEALRRELPGVLNWALDGLAMWRSLGGLQPPAAVSEATADYREEMDRLAEFLADECEVGPDATAKAGELYERYRDWATRNGVAPVWSNTKFGAELNERQFAAVATRDGRLRAGLRLRPRAVARLVA